MRVKRKIVFFALLSLGLTSCGYVSENRQLVGLGSPSRFTKAQLSFSIVNRTILEPKCVGCHHGSGARGGVALDSYENVIKNIRQVEQTTLVTSSMPKNGSLSAAEKNLLAAWIHAGAPQGESLPTRTGENPTPPGPGPGPVRLEPTFASIKGQIFERHACYKCHVENASGEAVLLNSIDDLVNPDPFSPVVVPGKPSESSLLNSVTSFDPKDRMPPPKSDPGLTFEEVDTIRTWITNGAKD